MIFQEAHARLGHCDKEKAIRTAKVMGWRKIASTMPPCKACAMGKAKQKSVPKRSTRIKAIKPGERLYHDISTIMDNTEIGCPKSQWHVSMDEYSQFTKSTKTKKLGWATLVKTRNSWCQQRTQTQQNGLVEVKLATIAGQATHDCYRMWNPATKLITETM